MFSSGLGGLARGCLCVRVDGSNSRKERLGSSIDGKRLRNFHIVRNWARASDGARSALGRGSARIAAQQRFSVSHAFMTGLSRPRDVGGDELGDEGAIVAERQQREAQRGR